MADSNYLRLGSPLAFNTAGSLQLFALNASNDAIENIFQVAEPISISRVGFRQGSITGTAPTYRFSLQGVDGASGIPDGTVKGGGTAKIDHQPISGDNNSWVWKDLDTPYSAGRGELLAMVIQHQTGTIDGSNFVNFGQQYNSLVGVRFPYTIQNDAGSRTRANAPPIFGYGSTTKAYGFPVSAATTLAFNSGSTPDEWAVAFNLPTTFCSTYKVLGVRFLGNLPAGRSLAITLYSGTTALQTVSHDTDVSAFTANAGPFEIYFDESSLSTLNAGSVYRIGFAPNDATNQTLYFLDVAAQADFDAYPGGQWFYASSRTDAGAWSDTTTRRMFCDLILADLTQPAGGGSSVPLIGQGLVF